jgi:hypothetical protein
MSIYGSTVLLLGFRRYLSFLILYAVYRTSWTGDQPVAIPLPILRRTRALNKRLQTSMPWVGFELTIPVFERAKTIHALDRAAHITLRKQFYFQDINVAFSVNKLLAVLKETCDWTGSSLNGRVHRECFEKEITWQTRFIETKGFLFIADVLHNVHSYMLQVVGLVTQNCLISGPSFTITKLFFLFRRFILFVRFVTGPFV